MRNDQLKNRLITLDAFLSLRATLKKEGKILVWTNGCFDLLHIGHVLYLEHAKQKGDILLVGINSDRSFSEWKNRPGPVHCQENRALLLCELRAVDYVMIYDDPSPLQLLRAIQPDIYVKGKDYTLDTIDQRERKIVENYGGDICFCSGVTGMSTTRIINRIKELYC